MSRRTSELTSLDATTALWIDDINVVRMSRRAPDIRHGQRRRGCFTDGVMRVVSSCTLHAFSQRNPCSTVALQRWKKRMESGQFSNVSALRNHFDGTACTGNDITFDLRDIPCRIVTAIDFRRQLCFVRSVSSGPCNTATGTNKWVSTGVPTPTSELRLHYARGVGVLSRSQEHQCALSAIEHLVNDGAMPNETHPGHELLGLLFDAVHRYETIHLPF
jgi:mRNA-degrading endonuclease HigB of HigAB toxin-antitoxin module